MNDPCLLKIRPSIGLALYVKTSHRCLFENFYQGLSRFSDGLLVAEVDLNLCRQVKDKWGFQVIEKVNDFCLFFALTTVFCFKGAVSLLEHFFYHQTYLEIIGKRHLCGEGIAKNANDALFET